MFLSHGRLFLYSSFVDLNHLYFHLNRGLVIFLLICQKIRELLGYACTYPKNKKVPHWIKKKVLKIENKLF